MNGPPETIETDDALDTCMSVAPDLGLGASSFRSVADMWHHRVGSTPDSVAMTTRDGGRWRDVTWDQAGVRVRAVANALLAFGLQPEQRCCILAETSVDWIVADLAILCAGGATTTLYPSSARSELQFIIRDCDAVLVFIDTAAQARRLAAWRDTLPSVQRVVVFEGASSDDGWIVSLADFESGGADWGAEHPEAYTEAHRGIGPDRLATLMYTSGTTGRPKGVMLTHDTWIYKAEAIDALGFMNPADVQYLWLPLAHVFAKVLQLSFIRLGIPTVIDGNTDDLAANLRETRPTWMASVPRVLEKLRDRIVAQVSTRSVVHRRAFAWALQVGLRVTRLRQRSQRVPIALRVQRQLADRSVFHEIRETFGGRLRFLISGGAPLPAEIGEFFAAVGIEVLEGYGLTESSAASCVNRLGDVRFGTVGPPLPGCTVKIADDGEILLSGRGIMRGYYKLADETDETLTADGFLKTGDIGLVLPSGHVRITGRKKEIIVTAGGKNIAPAHFEALLRTRCPYVSNVVMHGDNRPYCVALVTLDTDSTTAWARSHDVPFADIAELSRKSEIRDLLQGFVDAVNRELPSFERVRRIGVLDTAFTQDNGLLTSSLKVKRRQVEDRYRRLLDGFYGGSAAPVSSVDGAVRPR